MRLCNILVSKISDVVTQNNVQIITTDKLSISHLSFTDAEFIVELLNEPSFIQFIGDRNVRTNQDARKFLKDGPLNSYDEYGFGLFKVSLIGAHDALGICGLVKRKELPHPDLGFAFLEAQWGNGYAIEASRAVLRHAASKLGLLRVIAIVNEDNEASIRLLTKLGFKFEKMVRMAAETKDICQYAIALHGDPLR